jgi:hypothetical protein
MLMKRKKMQVVILLIDTGCCKGNHRYLCRIFSVGGLIQISGIRFP